MGGPKRGAIAHGIAIQLALAMMSDGRAKSKTHAAQLAGIPDSSLKPEALKRFATRNPIGKQLGQNAPALLEITAEVGGKRVSARTALSSGVESAIAILAKAGPNLARLSKKQRERVRDAKQWLEMSRSCGLFAPSAPLALPAELHSESTETAPESESVPGALDEFTDDEQTPLTDNE